MVFQKSWGWSALGSTTLNGVSRKLFPFRDNDGNKYLAIGMDKFLLIYFEDNFMTLHLTEQVDIQQQLMNLH